MNKLDRKLLRDLAGMKGQALAIVLVIAAGIAVFVMSMCAYASLEYGQQAFYRDYRFADVFCQLRRCPDSMISRIESIPGVSTVEARLVFDVLLDVPNMVEPATARLISVPDRGENRLNQIHISLGRMLEPGAMAKSWSRRCSPKRINSYRGIRCQPSLMARFSI